MIVKVEAGVISATPETQEEVVLIMSLASKQGKTVNTSQVITRNNKWTPESVEILRKMRAEGKTRKEMAEVFNVREGTISSTLNRFGISQKKPQS